MKVKDIWKSSVDRLSDTIALSLNNTARNHQNAKNSSNRRNKQSEPTIVFVLPLAGRFQTFKRFLNNYEHSCLHHPETLTELLIVLFDENESDLPPFYNELDKLREKYKKSTMNHITIKGNFSRGIALNRAIHSEHIHMNDIIFFIDVDITFKRISIERIRINTMKHKQVYLPIVFSQYNPTAWSNNTSESVPFEELNDFNDEIDTNLNANHGYFRQYGYGICAIYKADILHPSINGFDEITGWGLEDVRFLDKIIKLQQVPITSILENTLNKENATNVPLALNIFRAPDPTLVHVYHDIHCDESLSYSQYAMCLGTKANTLGSYKHIESIFMRNQTIIDFIRSIN